MKVNLSLLILFVALPLTLFAESREVKIGVIVPLSGDMAVHGVEIQRAMQLAEKEIKNSYYKYQLIFEDNRLEAVKSVSAARRLIDLEKVDVVVTLWPPTAEVVIPLTEKGKILHYTISWDPALAKKNELVLSHQAMVDGIARETLKLVKAIGIRRLSFLHMEETGFNLGASYIRQIASQTGVELAADEAFSPQERDVRSLLARVKRENPDGYLVWAVMPSIDVVIRQIREQNKNARITGYLDYAEDLLQLEGADYISEMYAQPDFIKKYQKVYGQAPVSKGANAYDIFKLIVWAYEGSTDKKLSARELKKKLLQVKDRPGAVGTFSIDGDGNSSYSPVWRRIEKGERLLTSASSEKFFHLEGEKTFLTKH